METGQNLYQVGEAIDRTTSRQMDEIANGNRIEASGFGRSISNSVHGCCSTVDQLVHENTWTAVGAAFGIGLIAGLILRD